MLTGCESCFDLVMAQVEAVREMRRNLTALLGQLLSQEMTADMGQFRWRLDRVVADTQRLLLYVSLFQGLLGVWGSWGQLGVWGT